MTRLTIVFMLVAVMVCCAFFTARAQEKSGLTILLESCIENNPELRAAYHNWRAAEAAITHKTALADPIVNFKRNLDPPKTKAGEQNHKLTISQMLPFPGKQKTAIRLNHQMSQVDKLNYEIKFRDIITEIKKSYAEVWFLQRAIKSAEANAKLVELLANESTANLPSSSLMPVLQAQSQLAQAANDLITYSELLETEKEKLKALTLVEELPAEWFVEIPALKIPEKNDELLEQALKNRIEIKVAQKTKDISSTRVKLAAFENKPDFMLGVSKALTSNKSDPNNVAHSGGMDPTEIFVELNLPIWGSKNRSRINEAREKRAQANSALAAEENNTRATFFKLWFNMTNRQRLYQLYNQTILPQAQSAMITAQGIFQTDKARFADYLEATTTAYAIKIAAARAEADYFISASELERWVGVPLKAQETFSPAQPASPDSPPLPKEHSPMAKQMVVAEMKSPEEFVDAVLKLNPDVEKQKQMVQAARHNLSQTQALEPLLNQFSSFLTMSPTLVPVFKEHPFPGVTAIKLRIAEEVSAEAQASFDYFLAKTANKARILAFQIVQFHRKVALISRTIKLYQDLKKTSESLYRNGKVSFAELTMISVEASRLQTQKNQYLIMLKELQEKAFAMLNGQRPKLSFYSFSAADFAKVPALSADGFKNHPGLIAEEVKISQLENSIALVRRAAFPEYTSISSLPMKKHISASTNAPSADPKIDANIDFSRVFVGQLKARRLAQISETASFKEALVSDFHAHSEAFRLTRASLDIIRRQMLPELEKAFGSVKSRYESGQASFQELVETEQRLLSLKEKLIDSEFETLKAKANMLYDLGKIQF